MQGIVRRKATNKKVVGAQERYIDDMLENGTIDLCSPQDGAEKCDEFLSSLEGSALEELTGLISSSSISVVMLNNAYD